MLLSIYVGQRTTSAQVRACSVTWSVTWRPYYLGFSEYYRTEGNWFILSQDTRAVQRSTCITLEPTFTSRAKCFWSIIDACFTCIVSFNCNNTPYEVDTSIYYSHCTEKTTEVQGG